MNTKAKGDRAVAHAICHFIEEGHEVLLPLGDRKKYDLVVDVEGKLFRIQCKFTGSRNHKAKETETFMVPLVVCGGNRSSGNYKTRYEEGDFDLLFVLTSGGDRYLVPAEAVLGKASVSTGTLGEYQL